MTAAKKKTTQRGVRQVTLKLPDDLHERLVAEADERHVRLEWLMSRLLVEAVERLKPADSFTLTTSDPPRPTPALFDRVAAMEARASEDAGE